MPQTGYLTHLWCCPINRASCSSLALSRKRYLTVYGAAPYTGHCTNLLCCPIGHITYILCSPIDSIWLICSGLPRFTGGISMYLSLHRTKSSVDQFKTVFTIPIYMFCALFIFWHLGVDCYFHSDWYVTLGCYLCVDLLMVEGSLNVFNSNTWTVPVGVLWEASSSFCLR